MNGLSMSKLCQGEALDGAIPNVKKNKCSKQGLPATIGGFSTWVTPNHLLLSILWLQSCNPRQLLVD